MFLSSETSTPDRQLLGRDVACTVITALALSRIDYCNAVLSGLPQSTIAPLQRVLNAAARDVIDALIGLHWLPVAARIEFKFCQIGLAPYYITDMLQPVSTLDRQGTLRSVERAFHIAAPRAWNSLPSDVKKSDTVKTFKKRLKTFLFCKPYDDI